MSSTIEVQGFAYSEQFEDEFQAAPPDVQKAAKDALKLLQANPKANSLRMHPLTGMPKPAIWKIDVFSNHSWQITFELQGKVAHLKRIATHKVIDTRPR